MRLVASFALPLTGDEAYYWTWSRHLAFGYVDHPPAVAWLIALGSLAGHAPGFVRLAFVLAEALATLAIGGAAWRLSGDERAGAIATYAFSCVPQQKLIMAEALPDGPYVLCWALALWIVAGIARAPHATRLREGLVLGLALGGAVLSRAFGWAVVLGVLGALALPATRIAYRRGLWLALPVALAAYVPFVAWNASHGWANVAFTLHDRQPFDVASLLRHGLVSTLRFAIYAVPLIYVAVRVSRGARPLPLVAATALPMLLGLLALAPVYPIESYWLLGPVASISVGAGCALARATRTTRRIYAGLGGLALALTVVPVLFLALPEPAQRSFFDGAGRGLRGTLNSGAFAYAPLAVDVSRLTRRPGDVVMVDRPEIAAELDYAGVDSLAVGFSPDRPELDRFHRTPRGEGDALFVRYAPVFEDARLVASLQPLCRRLDAGPELVYRHAGIRSERFFTVWCRGPARSR